LKRKDYERKLSKWAPWYVA